MILISLMSHSCYAQLVKKIILQDNNKTDANYILKLIDLEVGEPLDTLRIAEGVARLQREPAFAHVYYQLRELPDGVAVVYGFQENFTTIPYFNFYTTNEEEVAYRVGIYDYNLLGYGVGAGVFYQRDIFNSFGFSARAPYLFSKKWGLAINIQSLTTEEPVFLNEAVAQYKYNNTSYELGVLYQFNNYHKAGLAFNFFTEDYEYLRGATAADVPQELVVDKNLLKLEYQFTNIKSYYQYFNGWRSTFNLQHVNSTDSTLPSFTIWRNDLEYFKRIGKKGLWANRLRIGFSTNTDSPFAPFAVDNNLNIRGVGNTIDRGTGALVVNTEYRYTLYDKPAWAIQSNVFIDAGSWRNPGGDLSDFGDDQNLRIYPGVGVRFIHKKIFNTILRIDYGAGITAGATQGLVFGIGQYF